MNALGSALSILDWLKNKLPIQNRVERMKNELAKLKVEKVALLRGDCNEKGSKRYAVVVARIDELNGMLGNLANEG
jgi:hypothetical protein